MRLLVEPPRLPRPHVPLRPETDQEARPPHAVDRVGQPTAVSENNGDV